MGHNVGVSQKESIYLSVPIAGLNFLMTFPGLVSIDHFGRKPLLYSSLVGCLISCCLVSVGVWTNITALTIGMLGLYIVCFAPGMSPVPWTMNSEIYPLALRSLGNSLATSVNWASNAVVSQMFPELIHWIGTAWTFIMIAGICFLAIIFVWLYVPETANLSLEEINELFTPREMSKTYRPLHSSPSP